MSESKNEAIRRQLAWAAAHGLQVDESGYLPRVDDNLRQSLSPATEKALRTGAGGELNDREDGPAKMRALHSSAALAVNAFDFWPSRDRRELEERLGLPHGSVSLEFEAQFETGLPGTPPTLDVVLRYSDGSVVAIESKFTEWMVKKPKKKAAFAQSYFPARERLWANQSLPRCQELAEQVQSGDLRFEYLDAPQLLKHALGLGRYSRRASLWYVFADCPGHESGVHASELTRFEDAIGGELSFRASSYRGLLQGFRGSTESDVLAYAEWNLFRYVYPPTG